MAQKIIGRTRINANELLISAKDEPAFAIIAERFEKESPRGLNKWEVANSAQDISSILNRYTRLKQINFYTHGDIGFIQFGFGGVSSSTAAQFLAAPHNQLFAGEGRVLFTGCEVGKGKEGRAFIVDAVPLNGRPNAHRERKSPGQNGADDEQGQAVQKPLPNLSQHRQVVAPRHDSAGKQVLIEQDVLYMQGLV